MWGRGLTIEEKRRKIGRFIGLRGCESPVKSEEELREEMRRREKEGRDREEEECWRRKGGWR